MIQNSKKIISNKQHQNKFSNRGEYTTSEQNIEQIQIKKKIKKMVAPK